MKTKVVNLHLLDSQTIFKLTNKAGVQPCTFLTFLLAEKGRCGVRGLSVFMMVLCPA